MRNAVRLSPVRVAALILALCAASCSASPDSTESAPQAAGTVTVFEGARVITGDDAAPIENATFVVEGTRFTQVGRTGDIKVPAGASRVNLAGRTVIPALLDTHTHLSREREALVLDLQRRAYWGVGAAMSLGQDQGALPFAIREETIPGAARYRTAGRGITAPEPGRSDLPYWITDPEEARKAVREQLRAGATAIKLFASGGVMTPGVDPRSPSFTEEELRAGVEEAHKAFRVVGAHAQATDGIKNAIRAGVDSIEHGVWLDEEAIGLMLERGTYLVATLTAPWQIAHCGIAAGIPPFMVDKGWQVLESHEESFRNAMKAGVNLAMGTDQGTPVNKPGENAQEILRIARLGLSNGAALMAATAWAAHLLRLPDEVGRIRAALAADLVVLDRDPIEDLNVLTEQPAIRAVIQAGSVVRTDLASIEETA